MDDNFKKSDMDYIIQEMLADHFQFERELAHLLNKYGKDTLVNVSDVKLAKFLHSQIHNLMELK